MPVLVLSVAIKASKDPSLNDWKVDRGVYPIQNEIGPFGGFGTSEAPNFG